VSVATAADASIAVPVRQIVATLTDVTAIVMAVRSAMGAIAAVLIAAGVIAGDAIAGDAIAVNRPADMTTGLTFVPISLRRMRNSCNLPPIICPINF
jgi:hypothetical protein